VTDDRLGRDLEDLRRRTLPDPRLGVFEITVGSHAITGCTTSREALDRLRRLAADVGLAGDIRLLPLIPEGEAAAVVTSALAPLLDEPKITAERVSDALHGEVLAVLERRESWLRVQAGDGQVAWLHGGYVRLGPTEWGEDWADRATARSVGAEFECEGVRAPFPTGARLAPRGSGVVETADGRVGRIVGGAARLEVELRAEARHLAPPELALRWFGGAPYLWGGRTEWGMDCSGLVQAVWGARGVALRRDADQQVAQGREIPISPEGIGYQGGDVLCFASQGRVGHVALWAGAGRVVHSALSRGGVGSDGVLGSAGRRFGELVSVRRPET
jgi:gamma-D-glutamyl-L-lysine dipeptidyl-peptidase